MNKKTKMAVAAAGLFLASATVAPASIIDFTAVGVGGNGALVSGVVDGVSWEMTAVGGLLNNSQTYDGGLPKPSAPLAFQRDGQGVTDDEISYGLTSNQSITLTFGRSVYISEVMWLDLFCESQVCEVGFANGANAAVATDTYGTGAGFQTAGVGQWLTSITFTVNDTNDGQGNPDGSLAAINVAAVPVPAAGFLLLGGLGGLAGLRRRKKN